MIDFSTDEKNNKVTPTISDGLLTELNALHKLFFFDVERYRSSALFLDFEYLTSVDYDKVLQNEKLEKISIHLIENKNQYNEKELTYLLLRHFFNFSWRLDSLFLVHLQQCAVANTSWSQYLRDFAHRENIISGQPYWLRNEQSALFNEPDSRLQEISNKIEFIMVKSKLFFPKCTSFGNNEKAHYFILMDSGIYPFLYEWIKILLSGYRIYQFNSCHKFIKTTEPVKTGAILLLSIANIINRNHSVFELPEPAFIFSNNDFSLAKEIVANQVLFLMGHECGHVYISEKQIKMNDCEEEIYADEFALDILRRNKEHVVFLNEQEYTPSNNVYKYSNFNRKIEAVELLFMFYEMYSYATRLLESTTPNDDSHPHPDIRRDSLRKRYLYYKETSLLDYAKIFTKKVKEEMKKRT